MRCHCLSARIGAGLAAALLALVLVACGESALLAGVGSGGTGIAEGAISGFGSVIVDGVEYDDSVAASRAEDATGASVAAELKLGQRVRVFRSADGSAERIEVLAQLIGPVTRTLADGELRVLDQRVRIVTDSGLQDTATVLDGHAGVGAITHGDTLEVHGVWAADSAGGPPVLVASRIEKRGAVTDWLLSGVVSARVGSVFTLNQSAVRVQVPDDLASVTAPGAFVRFWTAAGVWPAPVLVATRAADGRPQPREGEPLRLSVQTSGADVRDGVLSVQGLSLRISAALAAWLPAQRAQVMLEALADAQGLSVISVGTRTDPAQQGGEILLKGAIVWQPGAASIRLRQTVVAGTDLPGVTDPACPRVATAEPVFVEIRARRAPPGQLPQAITVTCRPELPADGVIRRPATLLARASDLGSLTVLFGESATTLVLTAASLLPPELEQLLRDRAPVEVEYQQVDGRRLLRQIRPPPPPPF